MLTGTPARISGRGIAFTGCLGGASAPCQCRGRVTLRVNAAGLTEKGRVLPAVQLTVGQLLGQGSFGQVFKGSWISSTGDEQPVVLKRVKVMVEGAVAMGQMELLLNAYAGKVARQHCADFLGSCEVSPFEANARLTPGLWLVWKYEGSRTLAYYLRRRDTLKVLAADLDVQESAVVATVIKQLLACLAAFHSAGLVHRDVKPLNIIFAEGTRHFKMIDLGACADLRTGTNYIPDESILDPNYCPPEQYVLPTDSPHLSKSLLKLVISPMLWAQHKPDRFDSWSAGVTLLQLAVPSLRLERGLRNFNATYGFKHDYDLDAWRAASFIPEREFEALDAENGAGWELAKSLLRPRSIRTLADGVTVAFVNDRSVQRASAGEALRHRFMKQAREPGSFSTAVPATPSPALASGSGGRAGSSGRAVDSSKRGVSSSGGASAGNRSKLASKPSEDLVLATRRPATASAFGAAVGLWRNLTNRLFDLEANIMVSASATQNQSTVVKKLQDKAAKGQVTQEVVAQEERRLGRMEQQLAGLQNDFNSTANAVGGVLGILGFGQPSKSRSSSDNSPSPVRSGGNSKAPPAPTGRSRSSSSSGGTAGSGQGGGMAAGLWAALQQRLSDLELKQSNQSVATERQEFTVRKLRVAVTTGNAEPARLQRAEHVLERMEKRVESLDSDLRSTRQEAQGLPGFFFNSSKPNNNTNITTSNNDSNKNSPNSSPNSSSNGSGGRGSTVGSVKAAPITGSKGVGGLFGWAFGRKGTPAGSTSGSPVDNKPSSSSSVSSKAQSAAPVGGGVQGQGSGGSGSADGIQGGLVEGLSDTSSRTSSREGGEGKGAAKIGSSITQGASALIANSFRFTGLAARVALSMAAVLKADAEKALRDAEQEVYAKRLRRSAELAFKSMLVSLQPPLQPDTAHAQVEAEFGLDPRFLAIEPAQRVLLITGHLSEVASATEAQASAEAKAKFQKLETAAGKLTNFLSRVVTEETTWEEVAEEVEALRQQDPACQAVDEAGCRALFERVSGKLKAVSTGLQAVILAESAFLDMLQDLDPPLTADSSWALLKPRVWRDFRYQALLETRRRQLFEEMHSVLVEAAPAASAPAASAPAASAPAAPKREELGTQMMEQLREEQARLRAEYDHMERKLRGMEQAMAAREAQAAQEAGSSVSQPLTHEMSVDAESSNGTRDTTAIVAADEHDDGSTATGSTTAGSTANTSTTNGRLANKAGPSMGPVDASAYDQLTAASASLLAAGVRYKRLNDGSIVFAFDRTSSDARTSGEIVQDTAEPVMQSAGSAQQ